MHRTAPILFTLIILAGSSLACNLGMSQNSAKSPTTNLHLATETPAPHTPKLTATLRPTITKDPTSTSFQLTKTPSLPVAAPIPCIPAQEPQIATVTGITDGDTITVRIDGVEFPLRYIGMDTPETHFGTEKLGPEAADRNSQLVLFKQVALYRDVSETDKYGRLLRYVVADGVMVNEVLIHDGLASAVDYPPDTACSNLFHNSEQNARTSHLGLWAALPLAASSNGVTTIGKVVIISVDKRNEVVTLQNTSSTKVNLSGWLLVSERGSQTCPLNGDLLPGSKLQVWAMSGDGFSCGFGSPIWNNNQSDPAVLYNAEGQEVSRYP